jgi:hypothetical protein
MPTVQHLIAVSAAGYLSATPLAAEPQLLIAPAAGSMDWYGYSVEVSEDFLAVSSQVVNHLSGQLATVYLYSREGSTWVFQQELSIGSIAFGNSISISSTTMLIGATSAEGGGVFYVFEFKDGLWTEDGQLTAQGSIGSQFGYSVELEGNTAIVGDPGAGAAYIFSMNAGVWDQMARLEASDFDEPDRFGESVSISADTVVIGAYLDDDNGSNAGAAYVFENTEAGWVEIQKLEPDYGLGEGDLYGSSVAIDGESIVVGARRDSFNGYQAGSAYVFRKADSLWHMEAMLHPYEHSPRDQFGYAVDISGNTIVVSSPYAEWIRINEGFVYVFIWSDTEWIERSTIEAIDPESDKQFGLSLALSGNNLVVGAPLDEVGGLYGAGSAYYHDLDEINLCESDFNGDSIVDGIDLGLILAHWWEHDVIYDIDGDSIVDGPDLGLLLSHWGPCP